MGSFEVCFRMYLALGRAGLSLNQQIIADNLWSLTGKLFGLTIKPERLQQIRQERRPNSRYSSSQQCQLEVQTLEALYRRLNIPHISTTTTSVEEIATMVLDATKLERRIY